MHVTCCHLSKAGSGWLLWPGVLANSGLPDAEGVMTLPPSLWRSLVLLGTFWWVAACSILALAPAHVMPLSAKVNDLWSQTGSPRRCEALGVQIGPSSHVFRLPLGRVVFAVMSCRAGYGCCWSALTPGAAIYTIRRANSLPKRTHVHERQTACRLCEVTCLRSPHLPLGCERWGQRAV